mmetsp:Transcript_24391/g.36155  ORF Transcript_24391/g.36155 Transcript_24391/m.36155 type:complete len:193 (+) Transcript_24391:210-788(+)|eukprot:CAMPEP_0194090806 /NCGR_PEP_ID=MMETSP0149-20130528/40642_1 /TAXON_ID=122233 /ORGANISM="Chaetoceros debilis, Strain MM31A-1" /LENGTH=192 /DNA_ID=CAMNT_0038775197 /DNA_START=154 /DNA_END=732 /DNA_ORIENTATION=+
MNEGNHKKKISSEIALDQSKCNVSAGGIPYEKAKNRNMRYANAHKYAKDADDAVPLGKSGTRGPNRTSDVIMGRHVDKDSDPDEEKYNRKGQARFHRIHNKLWVRNDPSKRNMILGKTKRVHSDTKRSIIIVSAVTQPPVMSDQYNLSHNTEERGKRKKRAWQNGEENSRIKETKIGRIIEDVIDLTGDDFP